MILIWCLKQCFVLFKWKQEFSFSFFNLLDSDVIWHDETKGGTDEGELNDEGIEIGRRVPNYSGDVFIIISMGESMRVACGIVQNEVLNYNKFV